MIYEVGKAYSSTRSGAFGGTRETYSFFKPDTSVAFLVCLVYRKTDDDSFSNFALPSATFFNINNRYKVPELLEIFSSQRLGQSVSHHISRCAVVDDDVVILNLLPQPMIVNIDMLQLGLVVVCLLFQQPHSLRIVTPHHEFGVVKLDAQLLQQTPAKESFLGDLTTTNACLSQV